MENVGFSTHSFNNALEAQANSISQIMSSGLAMQDSLKNTEQLRTGAMLEQGKGQHLNVVG